MIGNSQQWWLIAFVSSLSLHLPWSLPSPSYFRRLISSLNSHNKLDASIGYLSTACKHLVSSHSVTLLILNTSSRITKLHYCKLTYLCKGRTLHSATLKASIRFPLKVWKIVGKTWKLLFEGYVFCLKAPKGFRQFLWEKRQKEVQRMNISKTFGSGSFRKWNFWRVKKIFRIPLRNTCL